MLLNTGKIVCQGDIKAFNSKEKSDKSNKPCDILIRQDNVRNPLLMTTVQVPTQSLMTGNYTPWIAYRGICEHEKDKYRGESFVKKTLKRITMCWYVVIVCAFYATMLFFTPVNQLTLVLFFT